MLLFLTLEARFYNASEVSVSGHFYFADGDCYARMTRVRMVMEHPFHPVHHHIFEDYPRGTDPHTTAPLDYLIALLAVLAKPFTPQNVDFAGAVVSPLLGVATACFLWFWLGWLRAPYRIPVLLLHAVSPILVHGTALGRPDHQSLLMFLLAVGLGAEWTLALRPTRAWGIVSGVAWGLALWTSLYEPILLLVLVLVCGFRSLGAPVRRPGYVAFAGVLLLGFLVDGSPVSLPNKTLVHYFPAWEKTVGELSAVGWEELFRWVGFGLAASPFLLLLAARRDRKCLAILLVLALVCVLTRLEARWGYFLGIVFVLSLPWQLQMFRWRWLAWCFFLVSLWPIALEWKQNLLLNDGNRPARFEAVRDAVALRDVAARVRGPVLAPWWCCPPLAYWSGQPAIAGSSHESMAGIVDSARFYLSQPDGDALSILRERKIQWVVAYDTERTLTTSATLLGQPVFDNTMAEILYERPHSAPRFLKFAYENRGYNLFAVEPER